MPEHNKEKLQHIADEVKEATKDLSVEAQQDRENTVTHLRPVKVGIGFKFALIISLLSGLLIFGTNWYQLSFQTKELESRIIQNAENTINSVANSLYEAISDDLSRNSILQMNIFNSPSIEYLEIVDTEMNYIDSVRTKMDSVYQPPTILDKLLTLFIPSLTLRTNRKELDYTLYGKIQDARMFSEAPLQPTDDIQYWQAADQYIHDAINNNTKPLYTQKIQNNNRTILDVYVPIIYGTYPSYYVRGGFSLVSLEETTAQIKFTILFFIVLTVLFSVIAALIITNFLIRPIKALALGARRIGRGDLKYRIDVNSKDELGQLADEFNHMTVALSEAQEIMLENQRTQEQMDIARTIQQGLVPNEYPTNPAFSLHALYRPAGALSGDYYDILDLKEDNTLGVVIADVSGKGVAASLVMVIIRTIFQVNARVMTDTAKMISAINDGIAGGTVGEKYATMYYYHFNYDTGVMLYTNGAHNPMIIYTAATQSAATYDTDGVPVGALPGSSFGKEIIQLHKNDIIILHTDGITEAWNEKKEMYGVQRLVKIIKENPHLDARALIALIVTDIDAFVGEYKQHDDMTLIILKVEKDFPPMTDVQLKEEMARMTSRGQEPANMTSGTAASVSVATKPPTPPVQDTQRVSTSPGHGQRNKPPTIKPPVITPPPKKQNDPASSSAENKKSKLIEPDMYRGLLWK